MNKIKTVVAIIIIAVIIIALFLPIVSTSAFAKTNKWIESEQYVNIFPDRENSNFIRMGGSNSIDGVQAESREETKELEEYLKDNNYILANSNDKEISDEELNVLFIANTSYTSYFDKDSFKFNDKNYRVYVYKPVLDSAVNEYNETGVVNDVNKYEIGASTVLINYFVWDTVERIGQTLINEEINENMPERYQKDAGFVEFITPINAEVTLHLIDNNYFYKIYLAKGKTLVKLRSEHYEITNINSVDIDCDEKLITNKNYFKVHRNPEHEPIVIDFVQLTAKYHIPDKDISGKPNSAWAWEDVDIEDLGDIIVEENNEENAEKAHFGWIVMILTLAGMGVGLYVFVKKSR